MRYAAKKDANQSTIVAHLRGLGFDVDIVHRQKRLYDLVVSGCDRRSGRDVSCRVELKVHGEGLTPDEADYHAKQQHRAALIVAESADDVLRWFGWV